MIDWDPGRYQRNASYVPALGATVYELLAPQPGERILDLGCGDGVLTQRLRAAGAQVVGVDASPAMIAAARGLDLDARLLDARQLAFSAEFEAVFSNAALHWIPSADHDRVLAGVLRALVSGGRFVAEFGGHGNVAGIAVALCAALRSRGLAPQQVLPWYFPSDAEYRARLEQHGFVVEEMALVPRPTPLPAGLSGWLDTFGGAFFARVAPHDKQALMDEVLELAAPALRASDGSWTADYVRLRFVATKP